MLVNLRTRLSPTVTAAYHDDARYPKSSEEFASSLTTELDGLFMFGPPLYSEGRVDALLGEG